MKIKLVFSLWLILVFSGAGLKKSGQGQAPDQNLSLLSNPDSISSIPAYQTPFWRSMGGPPGGIGYDIRMKPENPDIMYVTDSFAGEFKSIDGGVNWFPVNKGIDPGPGRLSPVFCTTIDPHDSHIIWVGTELTGHIYRSTNEGKSWESRDAGIINYEINLRSVRGITIDPNNQNVVYAGVEITRFDLPKASGRPGAPAGGEVYKSTNGGESWTRIWEGDNIARYVWVDPRNSNRLYVSTGIFDRDAANSDLDHGVWGGEGILRSEDGGKNWKVLDENNGLGGLYIPSLFMHPTNPDILIAAVSGFEGRGQNPGVYATWDRGDHWTAVLTVTYPTESIDAVEIATSDTDIWYAASEGSAYRSDDAGQTWQKSSLNPPDRKSGMPIDLQVDPRDPYRIFDNNYGGGNYLSTNGGQNWFDTSTGYSGAAVDEIEVLSGSGEELYVTKYHSHNGGIHWVGNDGPSVVIQPNPESKDWLVGGDDLGAFYRSFNGGTTWISNTITDVGGQPTHMRALTAAPSNPQVMYTGIVLHECFKVLAPSSIVSGCQTGIGDYLRSQNGGKTWVKITVPFTDTGVLRTVVHPTNPQQLYVATGEGLYYSGNGGGAWQLNQALNDKVAELADPAKYADQGNVPILYDVALDPHDLQTIYVASRPTVMMRTKDGGGSWEQIAVGVEPNELILDVEPDPNREGLLYAASSMSGVYFSLDGGDTWIPLNNNLRYLFVHSLGLNDKGTILYAGTSSGMGGTGVWKLGPPVWLFLPTVKR